MTKRTATFLADSDDEFSASFDGTPPVEDSPSAKQKKKRGGPAVTRKTIKKSKKNEGRILGDVDESIPELAPGTLGAVSAPKKRSSTRTPQMMGEGSMEWGSPGSVFDPDETTSDEEPVMGRGSLRAVVAPKETTPEHTPWVPEDWISTLFESTDKSSLKTEIRQFVAAVQKDVAADLLPVSNEYIGAFLDDSGDEWASHCAEVDAVWEKYAPKLAETSGCDLSELVKPSGPLRAYLSITWHYPTNTTAKKSFGMVMDPSNPCLRMQKLKIGMSPHVLTYDAWPLRIDSQKSGKPFVNEDWWNAFEVEAVKLQAELRQCAKFRLVLGKENNDRLETELRSNKSTIFTGIDILINGKSCQLYGRKARFFIIRDKATMEIQQIVMPCYHLEYFLHPNVLGLSSQLCDTVWNIASACIGLRNVNASYFSWKYGQKAQEPDWSIQPGNSLDIVIQMVAWEECNEPVPEELVRKTYTSWLSSPTNLTSLNPNNGSLARQILCAMGEKGHATKRTAEWKFSAGYQRQLAGVAKGVATRRTQEYKDSEGYKRQRAEWDRRHTEEFKSTAQYDGMAANMAQSIITRQAEEWKSSEGHKKMLANLAKGAATMQTEEWKSSEARQRQLTALSKGVATRKTEAYKSSEGYRRQQISFAKGRATQKSEAWKSSEGRQKQLDGLANGRKVLQSEEYKSSEGYARLRAALKRNEIKATLKHKNNAIAKWEGLLVSDVYQKMKDDKESASTPKKRMTAVTKWLSQIAKVVTLEEKREFMGRFTHKRVIPKFYSKKYPDGMRWRGDGGPGDVVAEEKVGDDEEEEDEEELDQ